MRKVKRYLSGIIAIILLIASIPMNVFASENFAITLQPENQFVEAGETATFSVGAIGEGLTYQWMFSSDGGESWVNSGAVSAKTESYSFTTLKSQDGRLFKCVIKNALGTQITSEIALLRIGKIPTISIQPIDQNVEAGNVATFTVGAAGEGLTYQWFFSNNGGESWTKSGAESAKTSSYSFSASKSQDGRMFKCQVSNLYGTVVSETATLHIGKQEIAETVIVSQPADQYVEAGETATFSVEATGENLTYQWFFSNNGGESWTKSGAASAKTASYSFVASKSQNGRVFKCQVTGTGGTIETELAYLNILAPASIISQPEDQYVEVGETATFSVEATGENLAYQWFFSNNGGESWTKSGAASAKTANYSFVTVKSQNGRLFKCQITNSLGEILTSEIAQLYIVEPYFTITFDAGEGEFYDGIKQLTNTAERGSYGVTLYAANGDVVEPTRANYNFVGWKYKNRLARTIYVSSDITVYAEWEPQYQITYNANGGFFSIEARENSQNWGFDYDEVANTMTSYQNAGTYFTYDWLEPQRNGYYFKGWKLGTAYVRGVTVNASVPIAVLYADWGVAQGHVTYDANGGYWQFNENEEPFTETTFYQPLGIYYLGWHEPIREGYEFLGWTVNGENVKSVELTEDHNEITVCAHWRINHNVTYDANGGYFVDYFYNDAYYHRDECVIFNGDFYRCISNEVQPGDWNSSDWEEISIDDLDEVRVNSEWPGCYWVGSVQEPWREGYEFLGWSTVDYAQRGDRGYEINLQGDCTFYATWGKSDLTITYDANGGLLDIDGVDYETFEVDYEPEWGNELFPWANRGEEDEYRFLGWSTDDEATVPEYNHRERIYLDDESITLYAVWEKRIKITFNGNGGTWPEGDDEVETRIEYKDAGQYYYPRTWNPERENYNFDGWMDEDDVLLDGSEYIVLEEDLVLTACWTKQVTVTYDPNGGYWDDGDSYKTWDGNEGNVHIGMEWPQKQDFDFAGWGATADAKPSSDRDFNDYDYDVDLHDDATYYAMWVAPFTVTYDANGGDFGYENNQAITVVNDENIHFGDYELRDWLNRDGYEFLGWDEDPTAVEPEFRSRDHLNLKGATTFYAIWHKLPSVTYDAYGGQWGDEKDNNVHTTEVHYGRVDENYVVGREEPWRDGYRFDGWVDANDNPVDNIVITFRDGDDYQFHATWIKEVTVTYDANGGYYGHEYIRQESWHGDEGMVHIGHGCPTNPNNSLTFVGWSTDQYADPATDDIENEFDVELHDDVTYYAIWSEPFTVTYVYGYDDNDEPISEDQTNVNYGNNYRLWGWMDRDGYNFLGWSEDPDGLNAPVYNPDQDIFIKGATTFYAVWEKRAWITYDAKGGMFRDGEEVNVDTRDMNEWYYVGYEQPELKGYRFKGWADSPDATTNNADNRKIQLDQDYTFYAVWSREITVTYDAGLGEWYDYDTPLGNTLTRSANTGEEYGLEGWVPERRDDQFEFIGWSYVENGTEADIIADNSIFVPLDSKDITLYAVWQPRVKVTFVYDGGRWGENDNTFHYFQYPMEDFFVGYISPWREGYEFLGWVVDPQSNEEPRNNYFMDELTEDITFYAVWAPKIAVTFDAAGGTFDHNGQGTIVQYYRSGDKIDRDTDWGTEDYSIEPKRNGYIFAGWVDTNGNQLRSYYVTEDITLVARWIEMHSITLDANGGLVWDEEGNLVSQATISNNVDCTIFAYEFEPEREGYEFDGWFDGDELINKFTFTEDHTYVAHWTPVE